MLFLFAGEMIASSDGLAYRIALLRRHMGMDTIIPYVLWVRCSFSWWISSRCMTQSQGLHLSRSDGQSRECM